MLKNLYNSCFSNNLSSASDFSIVVVIIPLVALDSTLDSVVRCMAGQWGHNEMLERQVGLFHQLSLNLLIRLPRLSMSVGFCFVEMYFQSTNS